MQSRHLWFRAVTALAMKNISKFTKNREPEFSIGTQNDTRPERALERT